MIELLTSILLLGLSFLILLGWLAFACQSLREHERRAAGISLVMAVLGAGVFGAAVFTPLAIRVGLLALTTFLLVAGGLAFLWPVEQVERTNETPTFPSHHRLL